MRPVLLLSLFIPLLYIFSSCKTSRYKGTKENVQQNAAIDTNEVAIIPYGTDMWWLFDSTYKAAALSNDEILLVDSLLKKCVSKYNESIPEKNKSGFGIDFSKYQYKKQYVAVINNKGEKIVWINGLCHSWNDRWKKEIVDVMDGGNCYFSVKINLSTMECFSIGVHGYA